MQGLSIHRDLLYNQHYVQFKKIVLKLKKMNIPIVAGGVPPTVKPEECLNFADYVYGGLKKQ